MKEISSATINKISETKLENSRQKLIMGFVKNDIPEQSNIKLAIPSHRTDKWITFEEFKELISNGKTLQELCITYSRHLMAFYSYLSRGKIILSKEQFVEEYEKGIPLDEISRSHNIPREYITYLREFYGIKRKGATYQKRLKNEVPLSQDAKDVIMASMLGDGHISEGGYFSEKHSEQQIGLLEWKGNILKSIMADKAYDCGTSIDKRSGTKIYSFCIRTGVHTFCYEMRKKFYTKENGMWRKIIPDNIEELLNEKVFAIWFMDDGNTDWGYRHGIKEYKNTKPHCKISTQCFSKEDVEKLQRILKNKWQLETYLIFIKEETQEQPVIKFKDEPSIKLINLLKPFSTPDLLYKFDEKIYEQKLQKKIFLRENPVQASVEKNALLDDFIKRHNLPKN